MNINLSETEIRALLVALEHTQKFQDEDQQLEEGNKPAGTNQWMKRKCAAEDLTEKLSKSLESEKKRQTRNKRMMKGTTTAVVSETFCGNDPVNW